MSARDRCQEKLVETLIDVGLEWIEKNDREAIIEAIYPIAFEQGERTERARWGSMKGIA
jgi:hypothetical protein